MDEKKAIEPTVSHDVKEGEVESLDLAEIFLREHNIPHSELNVMLRDEEEQKKLVRRVDWMLMPLLCGTFLLQYIDKQVI
jgi:hypothetical protein